MSVLERARAVYTRLRTERNGHSERPVAAAALHAEDAVNAGSPAFLLVADAAGLAMATSALDETAVVGLDVETTGLDPRANRLRLLSLAADTIDGGTFAYLIDCFAVDPSPLWDTLSGKEIVAHNAAFDLGFLAPLGFIPTASVHDTMLLAHLLTAGTGERITLADCCRRWLGRDLDKSAQSSDWSGNLTAGQLTYAATDAAVLVPLLQTLEAEVRIAKLAAAAAIERRCLPAVVWMNGGGVALDRGAWQAHAGTAAAAAEHLLTELNAAAPPKPGELFDGWNWDSPAQVKRLLALVGCAVDSTADGELAKLDHPIAALLRKYRDARKQATAFGTDWLRHVAADGRVYPHWRQVGPASGRMACSDPNLQQLPRGAHRRCVTAPPGRILVKADYSQIELRIAAKIANESAMIDAYVRGDDLHALTARQLLGKADVSRAARQLAKALNFGLLYGMGARGFRQYAKAQYGVDLTEAEAGRYRDTFFRSYPGLAAWHRRVPVGAGVGDADARRPPAALERRHPRYPTTQHAGSGDRCGRPQVRPGLVVGAARREPDGAAGVGRS